MLRLTIGTQDKCRACGEALRWTGVYWEHIGEMPRHIAAPDYWSQIRVVTNPQLLGELDAFEWPRASPSRRSRR